MATDTSSPRQRGILQQATARWWWIPLIVGVVWFVIAWLVLRANATSLATVGLLVGVVFLMGMVQEIGMAAVVPGWRVLHIALAIVFLFGGLWALIRPINTFFALASVLGLLLFLQGVTYVIRGLALREATPYWWLDLVGGGLLTLLAIWVSSSDRMFNLGTRAAFILLWVGFAAIFRGISAITLAFSLRRLGTAVADADSRAAMDNSVIPPQERRAPEPTRASTPSG